MAGRDWGGARKHLRDWNDPFRRRKLFSVFVAGLAFLALLVPFWPEFVPEIRLGMLLCLTAALEWVHGFRRSLRDERRAAWLSGALTFGMGGMLLAASQLLVRFVVAAIAAWFFLDALRNGWTAIRQRAAGIDARLPMMASLGNLLVGALILGSGERGALWTVALAVALRLIGTAARIARAPVYQHEDAGDAVVRDLGLDEWPELRALGDRIEEQEASRRLVDGFWVGTFIITLFAIHLGRMGLDRSTLGIVSPALAVVGDLVVALVIGLGVVVPARVMVRALSRPVERIAWAWCLRSGDAGSWRRVTVWAVSVWLTDRLRFAVRLRQASYSLRVALARGLQIGLPVSAILAATSPMWGMSWYFDTENYAAGIWNSWAEARTDIWREAVLRSIAERERESGRPAPDFALRPDGVTGGGDFSFVVIGDTGEGDASQHSLRDSLIRASDSPETKFVVISSDVVYPTGAMRDYEANFWLPFKGVEKPVYAIPGNHDWYDALEAFAATFFDPDSARVALRARAEADLSMNARVGRRIERYLAEAERLRKEYRVPTGYQTGPVFQIQTDRFALIAVDTGVRKRVDGFQWSWLESALEASRGKFKMVLLGHPLYAVGEYRAAKNPEFQEIHELLRRHDVRIVMAGDTHDFEYYREFRGDGERASDRDMHHFVNGGGGAFLTMGAQLRPRDRMPTSEWAFYPPTRALVEKVEANTAMWKMPLWWWTRDFGAWPSAPEWLSAAFDYNVAPFFQSFVEVRVEPSRGRVRLMPWGVHGRLTWREMESAAGVRPDEAGMDEAIEWSFPM